MKGIRKERERMEGDKVRKRAKEQDANHTPLNFNELFMLVII
jgi:hypothetical protein